MKNIQPYRGTQFYAEVRGTIVIKTVNDYLNGKYATRQGSARRRRRPDRVGDRPSEGQLVPLGYSRSGAGAETALPIFFNR